MSTCRSCDVCHICGRYYLKRQGITCKWLDPSYDRYGFDCEEIACPFCKYCCIDHCDSDSRLLKAAEIRKKDYIRAINDITKRLKRRKRKYAESMNNIITEVNDLEIISELNIIQ